MGRIPTIPSRKIISFLKHLGFKLSRKRGSHKFYRHPEGRTATIPDHKGEDLGRGLVSKILNDIEVDREEFVKWLQKER